MIVANRDAFHAMMAVINMIIENIMGARVVSNETML